MSDWIQSADGQETIREDHDAVIRRLSAEIERLRAFLQDALHSMERGGFNRPLQERLRRALDKQSGKDGK